jgi:TPR repeat protein
MYASGQGVNKDFAEAVKWMELSAKQGHPSAQHNLGVLYAFGLGAVPEDYVLGFQWLKVSIANGNQQSQEAINILGKKMSAEQLVKAQAMVRECMASGYTECGY